MPKVAKMPKISEREKRASWGGSTSKFDKVARFPTWNSWPSWASWPPCSESVNSMRVAEALAELRRTGTVRSVSGKLKIHLPETPDEVLQRAIETLRQGKAEAIALLAVEPTA